MLFWEMIFGIVDVLAMYGFSQTYFRIVKNLSDYVTFDYNDLADFRNISREKMIVKFKQDFYIKKFSQQDQDKRDDGVQNEIKFGLILFLIKEDKYQ